MEKKLIAGYRRSDARTKWTVLHYERATELRCYRCSCEDDRELGMLVNGQEPQDYLLIEFFNFKGAKIWARKFNNRDDANAVVSSAIKAGFKKIAV